MNLAAHVHLGNLKRFRYPLRFPNKSHFLKPAASMLVHQLEDHQKDPNQIAIFLRISHSDRCSIAILGLKWGTWARFSVYFFNIF